MFDNVADMLPTEPVLSPDEIHINQSFHVFELITSHISGLSPVDI